MKNIILIVLSVLCISLNSCSSSDDNNNSSNSSIQINPPSWIQGTWLIEGEQFGWRFTSNNIIRISPSVELNFREVYQNYINNGGDVSVTDTSTDETYIATFNLEGVSQILNFTKISDTEITEISTPLSVFIKQ